jgi:hypothetical protein
MNFNYSDPIDQAKIAEYLQQLAEEISIEENPLEHRTHLGVSIIGEECSRKLWYSFRWVKLEQFSGRMRRLFKRGRIEEEKFYELLFTMGFFIREIDLDTNKQYVFSAVEGHYGGSSDSLAIMPWDRTNESPRILVEYKTHNKKYFEQLQEKKLKIAQPKHYAQMCGYGRAFKTQFGLYCALNKDNDEYYFEFLELDWNFAEQLERKAFDIITAKFPPPRISDNSAYWACKFCHFSDICHWGAPVEKNCRSCKFAEPAEKAEWNCTKFGAIIPKDFIPKGCSDHASINA